MLLLILLITTVAAVFSAAIYTSKLINQINAFIAVLAATNEHLKHVDPSHGMYHAIIVLAHAAKAIKAHPVRLSLDQTMSVLLAAVLHDTDDRKLFPDSKNYDFATQVMSKYFPELQIDVIKMISLVSASGNGNNINPNNPVWYYIPRYADRLDAIGTVGIVRCIEYNRSINTPLFLETTPRATTKIDLYKIVVPERFKLYQSRKTSVSVIDHMYDKLMHLKIRSGNRYIDSEMEKRHEAIEDFLLEFGRSGQIPKI